MKKAATFALTILVILIISGCTRMVKPVSQTGFYLDTVIRITLYDTGDSASCSQLIQECFNRISSYESLFSATLEGSDVWKINHSQGQPVTVSDDTAELLQTALYYASLSDGLIDPSVRPLSELWDFGSGSSHTVPDEASIQEALSHVDYRQIHIEDTTVTLLDPSAAIDLGFIAKGYIADRLRDYLLEQGVEHACISLGGNLLTINDKPDGTPYRVGIQQPFADEGETITVISVTDLSVVSSGIYERCFYEGERLYHHLLDTKTGYPADNNIAGVTILSSSSVEADALSTTCYFLGVDAGMELIESLDGVEALFILKDQSMLPSSGFPSD